MGMGLFGVGCGCCGSVNDCPNDSNFEDFPFSTAPPPDEFFHKLYPNSTTDWLGTHYGYCYFLNGKVRMRAPYNTYTIPGTFPPIVTPVRNFSYMRKRDFVTPGDPNATLPFYKQKRQSFFVRTRLHPVQNITSGPLDSLFGLGKQGIMLHLSNSKSDGISVGIDAAGGLGGTVQGNNFTIYLTAILSSLLPPVILWQVRINGGGTVTIPWSATAIDAEIQAIAGESSYTLRYLVDGSEVAQTTDTMFFWDRCSFSAGVEFHGFGRNPGSSLPWNQNQYAEFEGFEYGLL